MTCMLPVCDLLVRFGGECDSYIHTLGCFSVMVASYGREESLVLKQFMGQ